MKKLIALAAALAVAAMLVVPAAGGAAGNGTGGSKASAQDKKFMLEALQTDLYEITGGEAARSKGQSQSVVKLGEMLTQDHSKSYATGKMLAEKVGAPVPTHPSMAMRHKLQTVGAMKGAAFDKAFVKAQIVGHEEAIAKASLEIKKGTSATVVATAKKDRMMYAEHLKAAKKTMGEL
jgi:predicted outer membrane protein